MFRSADKRPVLQGWMYPVKSTFFYLKTNIKGNKIHISQRNSW